MNLPKDLFSEEDILNSLNSVKKFKNKKGLLCEDLIEALPGLLKKARMTIEHITKELIG